MPKLLLRFLRFATRFVIGVENFGLFGAIRVFVLFRKKASRAPISIDLRRPHRRFYFRGVADDVVSHFYKEGYRILDSQSANVRNIIDAGAHIGDQTLRFRYFHPGARIVAIEAEVENFRLLQRNTAGDPLTTPLNRGLWSKKCRLKVLPSPHTQGYRVTEDVSVAALWEIEATTISEIMSEFKMDEVDILKLDIEGAEKEVFRAAAEEWLPRVKVIIFECPDSDNPGTTQVIYDKIRQAGLDFNTCLHGENIVLIRSGLDWSLATDLYFER